MIILVAIVHVLTPQLIFNSFVAGFKKLLQNLFVLKQLTFMGFVDSNQFYKWQLTKFASFIIEKNCFIVVCFKKKNFIVLMFEDIHWK